MGRLINTTSMTVDGVINVGDWSVEADLAPIRRFVQQRAEQCRVVRIQGRS
jgi:hypothetical protein